MQHFGPRPPIRETRTLKNTPIMVYRNTSFKLPPYNNPSHSIQYLAAHSKKQLFWNENLFRKVSILRVFQTYQDTSSK